MTCRFVILKEINGEPGVFIEYDEKILAERIKARMKEYYFKDDLINLLEETGVEDISIQNSLDAFDAAFNEIMTEFK